MFGTVCFFLVSFMLLPFEIVFICDKLWKIAYSSELVLHLFLLKN